MTSPRRAAGTVTACATALGLGLAGLVAFTGGANAATTNSNLVVNPGFETGTLANWNCDADTGSVVTSPVHSGSYALAGAATSSDDAQCTQTISVQPNSSYSLSSWVQGSYVYLGTTGDGTTDVSTWSSNSAWNQLSTSFKTGASTTSVTIYLHGWYGEGTYNADDVSLTGPAGSSPQRDRLGLRAVLPHVVGHPTQSSSPPRAPAPRRAPPRPRAARRRPLLTPTGGGTTTSTGWLLAGLRNGATDQTIAAVNRRTTSSRWPSPQPTRERRRYHLLAGPDPGQQARRLHHAQFEADIARSTRPVTRSCCRSAARTAPSASAAPPPPPTSPTAPTR
ncbi:hypothetical protein GXW82_28715 [Streptacidiphilus sp. 4-A2]|nr:hypothetical protein [Streptacidiphilus sp. 4-A2]